MPALGISLFLIAVGAIVRYGINTTAEGVDLEVIGLILMAVGGIGILMSLLFMMSFSPFARGDVRTDTRDL